MKETIPLKRVGRKWDIAMAVVFLSSPAAAYITGANAAAVTPCPNAASVTSQCN
jgi:NAD(P)-dependent dehydrogenase (short-subunit alcohol dehydrogenase family)